MTKHQHYGTCDLDTGSVGSVLGLSYPDERAYERDGVCSGVMTIQVGTIMLDTPAKAFSSVTPVMFML